MIVTLQCGRWSAALDLIEPADAVDQTAARVGVELAGEQPGRLRQVAGGDSGVELVAEGAQAQEAFVVVLDLLLDPGDERAGGQVAKAAAVKPIGDNAVLLGGRQPAQARLGQRLPRDRDRLGRQLRSQRLVTAYT